MSDRAAIAAAAVSASLARLRAALVAAAPSQEHRDAVSRHLDAARDHVLAALAAAGYGAERGRR